MICSFRKKTTFKIVPFYTFILLKFLIDINECDFTPCNNNGTCINSEGSYTCNCTDGWTDKNCNEGNQKFKCNTYNWLKQHKEFHQLFI